MPHHLGLTLLDSLVAEWTYHFVVFWHHLAAFWNHLLRSNPAGLERRRQRPDLREPDAMFSSSLASHLMHRATELSAVVEAESSQIPLRTEGNRVTEIFAIAAPKSHLGAEAAVPSHSQRRVDSVTVGGSVCV